MTGNWSQEFFQLKHLRRNFYLVLYTFATSSFWYQYRHYSSNNVPLIIYITYTPPQSKYNIIHFILASKFLQKKVSKVCTQHLKVENTEDITEVEYKNIFI